MPLIVPAFQAMKNVPNGQSFVMLFELTYDDSDPSNPIVLRFAQATYGVAVTFEGVLWEPFPIGSIELTQSTTGEIPAVDIAISNAGRLVMGIIEQYEIENKRGRLIWVHPDHFDDPAARVEEPFTVVSARATDAVAVLTVAPLGFDPLTVQLPRHLVSLDEFPGVVGNRGSMM